MRHLVFMSLVFLLVGCETIPPPASSQLSSIYKASIAPPVGYARVYVIAPIGKNYTDEPYKITGLIYAAKAGGKPAIVGVVSETQFVAFDTLPGDIFLKAKAYDYTPSQQHFNLSAGETIALQPITGLDAIQFISAGGGLLGALMSQPLTESVDRGSSQYKVLNAKTTLREVQDLTLTGISPEASAYVKQNP